MLKADVGDHVIVNSSTSRRLAVAARKVIPGGVNSPVRAFNAVGGHPPFLKRGKGCRVWDVDGNEYIDYLGSWGPLILGHAHPNILRAIQKTAADGTTFGACTERETTFAREVVRCVPSIEMVRLVSSGTEATMSAIRLARAYTGRERIVKFIGGYHGHADSFLVAAGSGAATFGHPSSPGVPKPLAKLTSVLPFNDIDAVNRLFRKSGKTIAALIVEPVAGNAGVIPPAPGFLRQLRVVTQKYGAVLIFDEVITGFRLGLGGAQQLYNIRPDLTTLGKIAGGGLPLAAFGGSKKIMRMLSPAGPVYQAGTLSGNPLAVAAGLAAIHHLRTTRPYDTLDRLSGEMTCGLSELLAERSIPHRINRVGSMWTVFFTDRPVTDMASAAMSDTKLFGRFHRAVLRAGIYLPPAQFEAWFLSAAHRRVDIEETLARARQALGRI